MKSIKKICTMIVSIGLIAALTGCSAFNMLQKTESGYSPADSRTLDGWEKQSGGNIFLENDNFIMQLDAGTTHFSVTSKQNGLTYYSGDLEGDETAEGGRCELKINYYDSDSQKGQMVTDKNSVAFGSFEVFRYENSIRVYYSFSLDEGKPFVPEFLNQEDYNYISEKLSSSEKLKLKLQYSYYPADSTTTEAKEIKQKYEYAKSHDIYVLKSSVSDSEYTAINGYMVKADYSEERYKKSLDEMKITPDKASVPLGFMVPVEYELLEDGFSAAVLSDLIETANDDFTLQSVELLPDFNCQTILDNDGFILVPDGSGAIIGIDREDNASYSQQVYGTDLSLKNQTSSVISQNAVMPVFGFSSQKGSYFSYITVGAQMATINASRAGNTGRLPRAYASFVIRSHDDFSARMKNTEQAVFSKNSANEAPKVRYVLLNKNAGISQMAEIYRNHLLDAGMLGSKVLQNGLNIYLDYTGYITTEGSFFGVPYQKKVILSTVSGITENVNQLIESGAENIYVRLSGFGNGGEKHYLTDSFDIDKRVGTVEQLNKLSEILKKTGGGLFLENDFLEVYKDSAFDSFSSTSDAVRRLDRTLASVSEADIVSLKDDKNIDVRYLVSPALYNSLAKSYLGSLPKNLSGDIGSSFSGAGRLLLSDFNSKQPYSRIQTRLALEETLFEIKENSAQLMTSVGNNYVWKYSEHIIDTPLGNSGYYSERSSVPFYSMVTAGRIQLAGEAFNTSRDPDNILLKSLLSNANLHYDCVTSKENIMELDGAQRLYPSAFEDVFSDIVRDYNSLFGIYEKISGAYIKNYTYTENAAHLLEYSNGLSAVVNTGDSAVSYGDIQIEAKSFKLLEGGRENR